MRFYRCADAYFIVGDISFKELDTFTAEDEPTIVDTCLHQTHWYVMICKLHSAYGGTIAIAEKSNKIESQYCIELRID